MGEGMADADSQLAAGDSRALGPSASPARLFWRRFLRHRLAVGGVLLLAVLALAALAAPLIEAWTPLSATQVDLMNRFAGPSPAHPLGTDELGRDLMLRLLYGGRVSLTVGLVAAIIASIIGTVIGLAAGYFGGWLDGLLMRVTDGFIALPLLPLLIVLAAVDFTKLGLPEGLMQAENASIHRIVLLVAVVGWTPVARLVRGTTLSIRTRPYVTAAHALGAGNLRVMAVHILPNAAAPMIVATTLACGNIILLESVLSFLGLGIQPPMASWGNMLTDAQDMIHSAPMLAVWPGVLIFLTVMAFNFLGDGLQDALAPEQ